jgi:hypothetical protein
VECVHECLRDALAFDCESAAPPLPPTASPSPLLHSSSRRKPGSIPRYFVPRAEPRDAAKWIQASAGMDDKQTPAVFSSMRMCAGSLGVFPASTLQLGSAK